MSFAGRRYAAALARWGQTMTLRRMTPGDPPTFTDVAVKGKRFNPRDPIGTAMVGAMKNTAFMVKIGNAEIAAAGWPGPPRNGDFLVIDGVEYRLQGAPDTRNDGETVVAHFMTVSG